MLIACFFFFKQKTAYEMLRSLVGSEMCIRDRSEGEQAQVNSTEAQREITRVKQEQERFEEKVLAKAKAERQELQTAMGELEGKLMVEMSKQQPLMEQVDTLRTDLVCAKKDRKEQEVLISQLHEIVKELKESREGMLASLSRDQDMNKHTVSSLERALEAEGIEHQKTSLTSGLKMVSWALRCVAFDGCKRVLVGWRENRVAERTMAKQQSSGLKLMCSVIARMRSSEMSRACVRWKQAQLAAVRSASAGMCAQLQTRLNDLLEEHDRVTEKLQKSEEERKRIQTALKEGNAEKQILVMEVENLKTVGEQLVSDLVATASEVFDELEASRGLTKHSSQPRQVGPTAQRIAQSSMRLKHSG
eukprot:TRINITY_DN14289_c0_g1_i2.p1 TRINITY_DN14289_c0_g1~~TRINITY_DN14289_c0_g1_i2.p1  ORF type:complete len:361 (+),score=114.83 TRINITY_DN14289_c0_g1_i2:119-1201(+)